MSTAEQSYTQVSKCLTEMWRNMKPKLRLFCQKHRDTPRKKQGYAEKKDYRNELRTLAKAMEIAPENNTVLLRLGRAYWRAGLPEKALEYYHIAEELYPEDPIVYANIGSAYLKLGHNEKAKEQYEKAIFMIEADPMSACADDIAITYGNYALCVGRLGDRTAAKKYLSIAKEKGYSKDSIDTICGELHLLRFLL